MPLKNRVIFGSSSVGLLLCHWNVDGAPLFSGQMLGPAFNVDTRQINPLGARQVSGKDVFKIAVERRA